MVDNIPRRLLLRRAGAFAIVAAASGLSAACSAAPAPAALTMTVYKDPNCGCCTAWANAMRATGDFAPTFVETAEMAAVKTRLRVPPELASCHTTQVVGFVIEGHVPAEDIAHLLEARPLGVIGLAVPGMPAGSLGMEMADGRREPYEVIAFMADGRTAVFARHA